jgi:formylglycine-generating enzyme required for sulfatase activity
MDFIEPDIIDIPEGEFMMGSEHHGENESPIHRVWVDAFALAKYPVTKREYAFFINGTEYKPSLYWDDQKFQHPDQPVVAPSWFDAVAYCEWLCEMTGKSYRLPTEAERERAARGGVEDSAYPWGDELPADHRGGRDAVLEPVGTDGPNGFGLYNMSEGVHEWCADIYDASYYANSPYRNPTGSEEGERRVARGGSWRHGIRFSRCAARSSLAPDKQFSDFGFRCAMTI